MCISVASFSFPVSSTHLAFSQSTHCQGNKMKFLAFLTTLVTSFQLSFAAVKDHPNPFHGLHPNQSTNSWNSTNIYNPAGLIVDLGYAIYQGVYNASWDLNIFKGQVNSELSEHGTDDGSIRFAAPPTGSLRWQLPRPPTVDRSHIIQATQLGSQCPQAFKASGLSPDAQADFISSLGPSSEDCLFLNIYAPTNSTNLPVLVYIHGGGYGYGNANQDLSSIIETNNNGFIGVGIQYRLGAFGFLSSDEVSRSGVVNAGLRDQLFALQWVQAYIHLFGGNASQVTIAGESAGAGSVMLQSIAFNGELGESLFSNVITASPYLPMQHNYNGWVPSQAYYAFAEQAGCFIGASFGNTMQRSTVFDCLVNASTSVLMKANALVSASGTYGTWAFTPVTDGTFIKQFPSRQLLHHRVNGARILSGNNANEGPDFVPQNMTTETDIVSWLHEIFPMFTSDNVAKILRYYPSIDTQVSDTMSTVRIAGSSRDNATVQQQRANDIYAESVFVCPSYWLAEAYTSKDHEAFKYQYSVLPALHGTDFNGYFGPPVPYLGAEFMNYFQRIWGNFIMHNNPSVGNGEGVADANVKAVSAWPIFSDRNPLQVNCKFASFS
jgi:carboxylesterase type B